MRPRSHTGGRHELGQNFLIHRPTLQRLATLAAATEGPILEIGAGDGALTQHLAQLGRDLRAIDIDARRVDRLRTRVGGASVHHADALHEPLNRPVIVGNIPFHLTTPLLRRLLDADGWRHAILLTQWEVARGGRRYDDDRSGGPLVHIPAARARSRAALPADAGGGRRHPLHRTPGGSAHPAS